MIKLEMVVDDIDYEAASDLLLPLLADKTREDNELVGNLLGSNAAGGLAKAMLRAMPQEKKDTLVAKALQDKKGILAEKAKNMLREKGIYLTIKELDVYDH